MPTTLPDDLFDGPSLTADHPDRQLGHVRDRRGRRKPFSTQRADIQGLRALAVLLVMLNHLAGWPRGGFVGVDVFFVISGYLITALLIRSAMKDRRAGRYFGEFYVRRARRILPAAVTVFVACWIAANVAFKGARVGESHSDIVWAGGFLANIHFAHIGTDYFQLNRAPSLVQHFWSLSVEEQFYVVWPVVVLLVVMLSRRRLGALLLVTVAVTLGSFVWAVAQTSSNPTGAYFSTFVRAWELGFGATVAVAVARYPSLARGFGKAAGAASLAGVVGIIVSAAAISSSNGFPAPVAAAPVLLTGVVILANGERSRLAWPLTNPLSRYLGDISYSLYLWHWPTIVIVGVLVSKDSHATLYYLMAVLVTLGVSVLSYHLVEAPIHNRTRDERSTQERRRTIGVAMLAAVALFVASALLYVFKPAPVAPDVSDTVAALQTTRSEPTDPTLAKPSSQLRALITQALASTSIPDVDLSRLNLGIAEQTWQPCDNTDAKILSTCVFPQRSAVAPRSRTVVLIGDSIMLSWIPAIRAALAPMHWKIYGLALQQCSAADTPERDFVTGKRNSACDRMHDFTPRAVAQINPGVVVLSSTEETRNFVGGDGPYEAGMTKTVRSLAAPGRRVITLSPPPRGKSLTACDTAGAAAGDCVGAVSSAWAAQSAIDKAVAAQTGTSYVDTRLWFCSTQGYCPAVIGGTAVTYDGAHLTVEYGRTLASALRAVIRG